MKKSILLKVCTVLLAMACMVSCGGKTGSKTDGQEETVSQSKTQPKQVTKAQKAKASKKKKQLFIPSSAGAPYEILVVADNDDFANGAYDSLYAVLTDDLPGVAQSEPMFKVHKVAQAAFSKTLRLCRNIIEIDINKSMYSSCKLKVNKNAYASPQVILRIQAPDAHSFKDYVTDNRDVITGYFVRSELNHQVELLRNDHNKRVDELVKNMFGSEIWVPTELTRIKTGRQFLWAASERFKDNVELDVNFVIYSYPYRHLNTFTDEYFIRKRDSVMKANVPGPRQGMYMQTTKPFVLFEDTELHKGYAQIARGLWDIKGYDMGGPFVSVARVDEKNQRVVVVEGFVYYPNHPKRDYIRRLEAALYTLRLPDELDLENFNYLLDEITVKPE